MRHGAWLALIALAVNLTLSFGHVHPPVGRDLGKGLQIAAISLADHGGGPGHSDGGQADQVCAICLATAAIANGLAATAPILIVRLSPIVVEPAASAVDFALDTHRASFESRGPPNV